MEISVVSVINESSGRKQTKEKEKLADRRKTSGEYGKNRPNGGNLQGETRIN
ncbi:hypothetical protein ACE4RR_13335 [Alteribacillus sp. HJP-4]